MNRYQKCIEYWDEVFKDETINVPINPRIGIADLDYGITWLCQDANTILDFGCGNGVMLFICALNGTSNHIGIDGSLEAINNAIARSKQMSRGKYHFINGGIGSLIGIVEESVDGVILSNIIDNLYPDDCFSLLGEIKRVLTRNGKVLVKLNQYLTENKIKEYKIKVIKDNLLDDGLLLWNNTTAEWEEILSRYFKIKEYREVYYQEYEQINRMFLLENI